MNWFLLALKNTFNFKDRARRREYGWFLVGNAVIGLFMALLEAAGLLLGVKELIFIIYILNLIISIPLWIAAISLTTRRLHDLGYSGWWQCLPIVVVLGIFLAAFLTTGTLSNSDEGIALVGGALSIIFILFALFLICISLWLIFKDGQRFENKYGVDPKATLQPENRTDTTLIEEKNENNIVQKF